MAEDKGKAIFGLSKIPDSELLKISQQELGKWKAYSEELEYEIEELKKSIKNNEPGYELTQEEKKKIAEDLRKTERWAIISEQNKKLREMNSSLRKTNKELIYKLNIAQGLIDKDHG